jgi:hypothetical protein
LVTKLWLTYAWKDNQDQDVDHVIHELQRTGLEVAFDRAHIIPGQRVWFQIDKGILDPATDAWAILATENSLSSEACLEELAYALDRALRTRGADFPLIGIFPAPIDRALIPSAIATRLYATYSNLIGLCWLLPACARCWLLDRLNSNGFDYWSDRLFHFPCSFLHWRGFGLGLCNRPFRSLGYLACLTAFS